MRTGEPGGDDAHNVRGEVAVRGEGTVAEVVDAELVPKPPPARPEPVTLIGTIVVRPVQVIVVRPVQVIAAATKVVATDRRTVTAGKATGRQLAYVLAGVGVVGRRLWEAKTNSRYERIMRGAEATGNWERLEEWEKRSQGALERRHKRRMDWFEAPAKTIRAVTFALLGLAAALLGLGAVLAVGYRDPSWIATPIMRFVDLIVWVSWAVTIAWGPFVLALPWLLVLALWHIGRTAGKTPRWLAPQEPGIRDVVPDEGAILNALRNLNLPPLDRKFKEGWIPRWVSPTTRDGKGWRTQLELPLGVTVEMINDKKKVLAHNLVRLPVEVWPTEPKRLAGVLDLWAADQGLLTGPVAEYPLLHEGTCDYFKGAPVGTDQRGEGVVGGLMACNYAVAGAMGSGKSTLVIDLCAGGMLDPLVDIDVYCMAYNVDYDPMRPRLRTLVKGDEDEHVIAAMDGLRTLRHEVTVRGKVLGELGGEETKVTRALAEQDPRLRPRLVVFDECQELFRHPTLGNEAKELAIKVMTKARKCAITIIWVTPEPSADSLPRELAKVTSHGVCFAITDHQGNDAIMGTGAHKRGVTAVSLVAGEDVGTAMARGFAPRPGLLRCYYIRKDKSTDELTPIVKRAMALLNGRPVVAQPARDPDDGVDYLRDILSVIGDRARVHTVELLRSLAVLDADTYGGWDTKRLKAETGLTSGMSNGTPVIRRHSVVALIAARGGEVGEADED